MLDITDISDKRGIPREELDKLGQGCANFRSASLLRLLLLLNSELCKCEKRSTSTEVNKVK